MDLNSGGIPDYSEVNSNLSDNEIDMTGMNSQEQGYSGTVQNPGMDGSYASQTSLEFEKMLQQENRQSQAIRHCMEKVLDLEMIMVF